MLRNNKKTGIDVSSIRPVGIKSTLNNQFSKSKSKIKIGKLLSKEGQITTAHLQKAINYQKTHGGKLSSILTKLGFIDAQTIVNVLVRRYKYQTLNLSEQNPTSEILKLIPYQIAKKNMVFPLEIKDNILKVTMLEPTNLDDINKLEKQLNIKLDIFVSTEQEIVDAFKIHYKINQEEYRSFFSTKKVEQQDDFNITSVDDFGLLVSEAAEKLEVVTVDNTSVVEEYVASDAPIIKLVNGIMTKAVLDGVSDIHIEPFENTLHIRYRLDGALYKTMNLPLTIKNALISRIKILAQLNIAERRIPQDGRIKMNIGSAKSVDVRVSTLPTLFGESVVMRILDKTALNVDLAQMGFEQDNFATIKKCITQSHGLILVTGPTGSGKTTTLYAILNRLNNEDVKILTVEDPVEFNFKGINQVDVKEEIGMTFPVALKAFLRQDPDIIMVGEIRDLETAEIAIKAAMTGHLVFSTLHTNDSPSTIGRLLEIGIPSYLLASSISMILSQRLARKLCSKCKVRDYTENHIELENMGFLKDEILNLKLYKKKGCPACNGTGFKGRTGLFELMEITEDVAKAINANVSESQLRKTAIKNKMITLREAALEKARKGIISLDEITKQTNITKETLPAYLLNPNSEDYEDGDIIIREGNNDKDFFQLKRGAVVIKKDNKKITEITEPDEYFGEMSAITGEVRSTSIISLGRSNVTRFPGDKLLETLEEYPEIAGKLFKIFAKRLSDSNMEVIRLKKEK